jgi:hypothetical protein
VTLQHYFDNGYVHSSLRTTFCGIPVEYATARDVTGYSSSALDWFDQSDDICLACVSIRHLKLLGEVIL